MEVGQGGQGSWAAPRRPGLTSGTWEGILRVKEPQAQLGSRFLCALGPEAEGAELKITGGFGGHLRWPDPPSLGDSCSPPQARLGHIGNTFSSYSPPQGDSKTQPSKEVGGRGCRGRGSCEGRTLWTAGVQGRRGKGPNSPDLSLPQALSPGAQDGGVSAAPQPGALAPLRPTPLPRPALAGQGALHPHPGHCPPAHPVRHTAPRHGPNFSSLSSPNLPSWDSEEVSTCPGVGLRRDGTPPTHQDRLELQGSPPFPVKGQPPPRGSVCSMWWRGTGEVPPGPVTGKWLLLSDGCIPSPTSWALPALPPPPASEAQPHLLHLT